MDSKKICMEAARLHVGNSVNPVFHIITNMELTVAEGNRVIYDGAEYSLAQFTAKYMPRNKRSVSGVCQGPKYFTFRGTSLYKYKEMFSK